MQRVILTLCLPDRPKALEFPDIFPVIREIPRRDWFARHCVVSHAFPGSQAESLPAGDARIPWAFAGRESPRRPETGKMASLEGEYEARSLTSIFQSPEFVARQGRE